MDSSLKSILIGSVLTFSFPNSIDYSNLTTFDMIDERCHDKEYICGKITEKRLLTSSYNKQSLDLVLDILTYGGKKSVGVLSEISKFDLINRLPLNSYVVLKPSEYVLENSGLEFGFDGNELVEVYIGDDVLAQYDGEKSCYMAINGNVVDVTNYIDDHPGEENILDGCGFDATEEFNGAGEEGDGHSRKALKKLKKFVIGKYLR